MLLEHEKWAMVLHLAKERRNYEIEDVVIKEHMKDLPMLLGKFLCRRIAEQTSHITFHFKPITPKLLLLLAKKKGKERLKRSAGERRGLPRK